YHPGTGHVVGLRAPWPDEDGPPCDSGPIAPGLVDRASRFLWSHADMFGLREGVDELALSAAYQCNRRFDVVFVQRRGRLTVPGTSVFLIFDGRQRFVYATVGILENLDIDPEPRVTSEQARDIAAHSVDRGDVNATRVGELSIQRQRPADEAARAWLDGDK